MSRPVATLPLDLHLGSIEEGGGMDWRFWSAQHPSLPRHSRLLLPQSGLIRIPPG